MPRLASKSRLIPVQPLSRIAARVSCCVARISPDQGKEQDIRQQANRFDDPCGQSGAPWRMPNPNAKGSIWVISNVRTIAR